MLSYANQVVSYVNQALNYANGAASYVNGSVTNKTRSRSGLFLYIPLSRDVPSGKRPVTDDRGNREAGGCAMMDRVIRTGVAVPSVVFDRSFNVNFPTEGVTALNTGKG